MTGEREFLGLAYHCSFSLPAPRATEEIARAFAEALAAVRDEELRRGLCLVGPHRDDLAFLFNGREARIFGSQAQQRTLMLSARLAEVALMREEGGEDPVVLLDDVLSELDEARRMHLFEITRDVRQVLLTGADLKLVPADARRGATLQRVIDGELSRGT
jgi:DNA replication and repair protein RecF